MRSSSKGRVLVDQRSGATSRLMGVRPGRASLSNLLILEQAASARSRDMGLRELAASCNQQWVWSSGGSKPERAY